MQKNSPLHVLVIPTWYPNGEDKLIGVYHKLFCTALAEYGVKTNMLYVDRQGLSSLPKYPTMQKLYEESNTGYVTYCRRMLDISKFSADVYRTSQRAAALVQLPIQCLSNSLRVRRLASILLRECCGDQWNA